MHSRTCMPYGHAPQAPKGCELLVIPGGSPTDPHLRPARRPVSGAARQRLVRWGRGGGIPKADNESVKRRVAHESHLSLQYVPACDGRYSESPHANHT